MNKIKFYGTDFVVDKKYGKILRNRIVVLLEFVSPKIAIHSILITTFGLKYNEYICLKKKFMAVLIIV